MLRRHEPVEDRRGCHRDARCGSAAMVRDGARPGQVQLPCLREDHAAAGAVPCHRPGLCRAEPVGDDAGRQVCQPSARSIGRANSMRARGIELSVRRSPTMSAPAQRRGCWAHARRKLFELADVAAQARKQKQGTISPIAFEAVQKFDAIFALELAQRHVARAAPGCAPQGDSRRWSMASSSG